MFRPLALGPDDAKIRLRPRLRGVRLGVRIRDAQLEDAATIAAIYNEGILDRSATLETTLRDADERHAWLAGRSPRHPVLVIEAAGTVVAWGSLNQFNPRPAYDRVADFSIYVARDRRGEGLGTMLLAALERRACALGYHKMVLAALPWNEAGTRLYENSGYRHVGTYREQGLLDGRWVDVVLMEKLLASEAEPPAAGPPISLSRP